MQINHNMRNLDQMWSITLFISSAIAIAAAQYEEDDSCKPQLASVV